MTSLLTSEQKDDTENCLSTFQTSTWIPDTTRVEYDDAISNIRTSILDGNFYQVNHTLRLRANFEGSTSLFHSRLLEAQRCGFGAFLHIDPSSHSNEEQGTIQDSWFQVLSASPELFFHWKRSTSGELYSRPMKGTRRRGLSSHEDAIMQTELAASIKDRAENLMIVDLLRNDMSRVASKGTVRVRDLFKIEKYPTVLQMTSGVFCTPKEGTRLVDVLKALFPCGSITGAPKLSAMKAISSLESSPRGPYCGMIIHIGPGPTGDISASVPIRTVVISREPIVSSTSRGDNNSSDDELRKRIYTFDTAPTGSTAEYGVGGGITWDSTANGEFDEVLSKAAVLFAASAKGGVIKDEEIYGKKKKKNDDDYFSLFETLRFCANSTTYLYKALHIQRLKESCEYFGFQFDIEKAKALLSDIQVKSLEKNKNDYRVRLCSSRDGTMTITCHALLDTIAETMKSSRIFKCILDTENPINTRSVHLYHKTTERTIYDNARAKHKCLIDDNFDAPFDVLLVNEFGHLTEFCIGNLVVELSDEKNEEEIVESDDDTGITISGQVPLETFQNCCEDLWPVPSPGYSFFTPPISSGLLPGVLRARLLHLIKVKTRIIKISDLESCKRIWLINSVRGWVQVTVERIV